MLSLDVLCFVLFYKLICIGLHACSVKNQLLSVHIAGVFLVIAKVQEVFYQEDFGSFMKTRVIFVELVGEYKCCCFHKEGLNELV